MQEWNVNAGPAFFRKRFLICLIVLPVMIYASLIAIHNLFGIDLTGGWFGEPRSASSGRQGAVLMGLPIYFFFLGKTIWQYYRADPKQYFSIDDTCVKLVLPIKRNIPWSEIEEIRIWNDYGEEKLSLLGYFKGKVSMKTQHLDIDSADLLSRLKKIADEKKIVFSHDPGNQRSGFFER